jgi:hypothetical protein
LYNYILIQGKVTYVLHVFSRITSQNIVTYSGFCVHDGTLLRSKSQYTTVKYSQQLFQTHVGTIHQRAIGPLAHHNSTLSYSPSLTCHLPAPTIECLHRPPYKLTCSSRPTYKHVCGRTILRPHSQLHEKSVDKYTRTSWLARFQNHTD